MTYSQIETDKAFRSYKFLGHRQATALAALQREILSVANRIKVSNVLIAKYPAHAAMHREMHFRDCSALYSLLNVKRALRGA